MTREELKEHCEKQIRACEMWAHSQGERPYGKVYEEHKLILELLEQKTRWIPVSERLPEELKGVLVYCPTNDNIFCAYLEKGIWKIFSPEALEVIKEIVTAWMPLPKPYSEQGDTDGTEKSE